MLAYLLDSILHLLKITNSQLCLEFHAKCLYSNLLRHLIIGLDSICITSALIEQIPNHMMNSDIFGLHGHIHFQIPKANFCISRNKIAFGSFQIRQSMLFIQTDGNGKFVDCLENLMLTSVAQATQVEIFRQVLLSFLYATVY